jgi:hypothetical protein
MVIKFVLKDKIVNLPTEIIKFKMRTFLRDKPVPKSLYYSIREKNVF